MGTPNANNVWQSSTLSSTSSITRKSTGRFENKIRQKYGECPHCKVTYRLDTLGGHKANCGRKKQNNLLMCDQCNFKTAYPSTLRHHTATRHGSLQDMPFKCPHCPNFAFLNKGPLTQHVAQRHPEAAGVSPQVCSDCGKICKSKHQLTQHKRRHHAKNDCVWQCKACSQVFSDIRAISKHVVLHSEIEFFQCNICKKTFKNESSGREHKHKVHGGESITVRIHHEVFKKLQQELTVKKSKDPDDDDFKEKSKPFKRFRGRVADTINAALNVPPHPFSSDLSNEI